MGNRQLTKFTFYDLYAELMDTLTDEERGKLLRAMCAYAFNDAPPVRTNEHGNHPRTTKNNIEDILAEDKRIKRRKCKTEAAVYIHAAASYKFSNRKYLIVGHAEN